MFGYVIFTILIILISFLGGIVFTFWGVSKINKKYNHGSQETDFDTFKEKVHFLPIDILLDISYSYGFVDGRNAHEKIDSSDYE